MRLARDAARWFVDVGSVIALFWSTAGELFVASDRAVASWLSLIGDDSSAFAA